MTFRSFVPPVYPGGKSCSLCRCETLGFPSSESGAVSALVLLQCFLSEFNGPGNVLVCPDPGGVDPSLEPDQRDVDIPLSRPEDPVPVTVTSTLTSLRCGRKERDYDPLTPEEPPTYLES